jgi:hypothetical protein
MLWFHRHSQAFDERTATELADDLRAAGFPKPNVSRLAQDMRRTRCVVAGNRSGTFQLDIRKLPDLDTRYLRLVGATPVAVVGALLPNEIVDGTRNYLQRIVHQINACYEKQLFDGSAVLCRRLMESLIIEVYVAAGRAHDIQGGGGSFFALDKLINVIVADPGVPLGRNSPKAMQEIKGVGDTAAHDRTYITTKQDLDDVKTGLRRVVQELLSLSGIKR